jgi:hypothetical protein
MGARMRYLAAAVTVAVMVCALPARALASTSEQSLVMDDDHLIYTTPAKVTRSMEKIAGLGVDYVRVSLVWSLVVPDAKSKKAPKHFNASNPGDYPPGAWDRYDLIVRLAKYLGLKVYFLIIPPVPRWAQQNGFARGQAESLGQAPTASAFKQFVTAIGKRYSGTYVDPSQAANPDPAALGLPAADESSYDPSPNPLPRVSYWGIWNEPNYPSWLNPFQKSLGHGKTELLQPSLYRGIVNAGYSALASTGHSHDTILIGETANLGNVNPIPFIDDLYCVNGSYKPLSGEAAALVGCPTKPNRANFVRSNPGLFQTTGWAHHPYEFGVAPNKPYQTKTWVTLQNMQWMETTLNRVFGSYGKSRRGGIPLYMTEWGYKTDPPNPYVATTQAQQAVWLDEGDYVTWAAPYVKALGQFLLYDDGPKAGEPKGSRDYWSTFQTGLLSFNGSPKPAFAAYRIPIWLPVARHGSRVTVWGQLRPADHNEVQDAEIQFQPTGSRTWSNLIAVQTSSSEGYFENHISIPAAGNVRIAYVDPASGSTYYSRGVAVS